MDGIVSETPSLSERAQDLPLPQNGLSINGAGSPNRDSIKEEHSSDDDNCIADVQGTDEASRLKALATDVRDQDDLERNVGRQVSYSDGVSFPKIYTELVQGRPAACRASGRTRAKTLGEDSRRKGVGANCS